MPNIAKPHTFTDNTDAVAAEVNADFDTVYNWVNQEGIHKDGTNAFTAIPSGPNLDPTTDNQLVRLKYITDRTGRASAVAGGNDASGASFARVNGWSAVGTTKRATVVNGGIRSDVPGTSWWLVGGYMNWDTFNGGSRRLRLMIDDADFASAHVGDGEAGDLHGSGVGIGITLSSLIPMTQNQVFQIHAQQDSGQVLGFRARLWAVLVDVGA